MAISTFNAEAYVNSFFPLTPKDPIPDPVCSFFYVEPSLPKRDDRAQLVREGLVELTSEIFDKVQKAIEGDIAGRCFLRKEHGPGPNRERETNALADEVSDLFKKVYGTPLGISIQGKKEASKDPNWYFIGWSAHHAKALRSLFENPSALSENCEHLNRQRKVGKYTDITFQVEGQTFFAHKFMFPENDFFTPLFKSKEPVLLKEVPAKTFESLLQYLYTGEISFKKLTIPEVIELAKLASQTSVSELQRLCHLHLILSFSKDTSPAIVEYAKSLKGEDPLHACCSNTDAQPVVK